MIEVGLGLQSTSEAMAALRYGLWYSAAL